jgi:hypothetical protein
VEAFAEGGRTTQMFLRELLYSDLVNLRSFLFASCLRNHADVQRRAGLDGLVAGRSDGALFALSQPVPAALRSAMSAPEQAAFSLQVAV